MTALARPSARLLQLVRRVPASAWVLIALFVIVSLVAPRFLTAGNLTNVLRVAAILAIAAYGQSVVIITGGLDFSIGSSVALTSVLTVLLAPTVGTAGGFAIGALGALAVGVINGTLVSRFDMPPFLVTLAMLIAVHGFASLLVGGIPLEAPTTVGFAWLGQGNIAGIPVPIIVAALGFAVLSLLLGRTVLGRSWYLIGAGPTAAALAGLHVRRSLFLAYVICGAFIAVAGLILTSRVSSGQPNLFPTLPFEAIAACAIGGLPLTGGRGRPVQVLIGVLVVAIVNNALVLMNFSSAVQLMLLGVLTVAAVLLQQLSWRRLAPARGGGAR